MRTQINKSNDTEENLDKNTIKGNQQNCSLMLEKRDSEFTKFANII